MNYLKKYSKILSFIICATLFSSVVSYAEIISGEIRKEISVQQRDEYKIPDNEPKYSTGAIFAYNKGIEEYKLTNYDKAIESFKSAVMQDSKFSDAYFNLGILYDYFDNTPEAIIAFNRAYITNKKDYEALYYMIKCYVILGDSVAAESYAKKIPEDSEFFIKSQELFKQRIK